WTRIVHHRSPEEGKNLGATHRHAGSHSDRLITTLHHSTELVARVVMPRRPYSQNIQTRLPTGDYASTIICASACLLLPSHRYSPSIGTAGLRRETVDWKHLLAYITGTVDQELPVRNEYLVTENRILRQQIKGRVHLSDGERKTLAEIGKKLGKHTLEEVASIVKPDTILAWHRRLVAKKF